jgi:hypothetical protein
MPEVWVYAIFLCVSGVCPDKPTHFSDKLFYSVASCRETGRGVALNLHLMNGKEYAFKCVHPDYEPKELR